MADFGLCVTRWFDFKPYALCFAGSRDEVRLGLDGTARGAENHPSAIFAFFFRDLSLFLAISVINDPVARWATSCWMGIQFQNPWFIGFMVLVTALFTANLFGLFEIHLGSKASTRLATAGGQGNSGHFWQGVFATLLATPCSAPFLGTAVAFALAAPIGELWLVFTALGIGMSLPWLLIAAFPAISRLLPKPGAWMSKLRVVLGVMMLLSCLWLISLLIPHFGEMAALAIVIVFLLLLVVFIGKNSVYALRQFRLSCLHY